MNNVQIITDSSEFEKEYRYITSKEWLGIRKKALNKGANILKRNISKEFKSALPAATKRNEKYIDRLIDAVRKSKTKVQNNKVSTKVHVMGTQKTGSGTFRARFFEGGTKERVTRPYTDKRGYKHGRERRGKILPLHFFEKGLNKSNEALSNIETIMEQEINKLNSKKFK